MEYTSALGYSIASVTPKGVIRYADRTNEFGNIIGHELSTQTALNYGERVRREFKCSCGRFTVTGYDATVKREFRSHVESER
jgi:NifB/MoaA-like Fe-S oxidoreductase